MISRITPIMIVCFLLSFYKINAQTKIVGECSLSFVIQKTNSNDTLGFKMVYVKGDQCKTVLQTPQLTQTLYFSEQQSKATVTKDIGTSHFLQVINYPPINSPNLLSIKFLNPDSIVNILDYSCKQLSLKWSDGTTYFVWYTNQIAATINNYELAFKEVPGLVLAYTVISNSGTSLHYQATKIDLSPISLSQFNVNKERYQSID